MYLELTLAEYVLDLGKAIVKLQTSRVEQGPGWLNAFTRNNVLHRQRGVLSWSSD